MELIHTCYRITDPDKSIAFYEALGFEKRRELPIREEAMNYFLGLPGDGDRLELTYNFGVDSYEIGTGYGHIAITVDDMDGDARGAGRPGHRARAAEVPGERRRLVHRLRARPRRLPGRADRKTPAVLTTKREGRSSRSDKFSGLFRDDFAIREAIYEAGYEAFCVVERAPTAGYLGGAGSTRRGS